jgi:hypothetical protein
MGWTWKYSSESDADVFPTSGTREEFASQADAESWLGENFRALLDVGVDNVTLLDNGSIAYTMSLHPAE